MESSENSSNSKVFKASVTSPPSPLHQSLDDGFATDKKRYETEVSGIDSSDKGDDEQNKRPEQQNEVNFIFFFIFITLS